MKRLMIATGLAVMFTLLGIFSAKADDWRRDRREWREHRRWERRELRREYRFHPYERCHPRAYYYHH